MQEMPYFDEIAEMRNHIESDIRSLKMMSIPEILTELMKDMQRKYNHTDQLDVKQLYKDIDALNYLLAVQHGASMADKTMYKPDASTLIRIFDRHKQYIVNMRGKSFVKKQSGMYEHYTAQIEACDHYLEKLGNPNWIDQLPNVIQTPENKIY